MATHNENVNPDGTIPLSDADAPPVNWLDRPLWVTFFTDHTGTVSQGAGEYTLRTLAGFLMTPRAASKDLLPWLKLARFGDQRTEKGALRHDHNVLAVWGIELDFDGGPNHDRVLTIDEAYQMALRAGVAGVLYSTPSSTPGHPRWRFLAGLAQPLLPDHTIADAYARKEDLKARRHALVDRLNGVFDGDLDSPSWVLSQGFYFGNVDGKAEVEVVEVEGTPVDLLPALPAVGRRLVTGHRKNGQVITISEFKRAEPGREQARRVIATTSAYHVALRHLMYSIIGSARERQRRAGPEAVRPDWLTDAAQIAVAECRAAMQQVPVEQRDDRWHDRFNDIQRCCDSIIRKETAAHDIRQQKQVLHQFASAEADAGEEDDFSDVPPEDIPPPPGPEDNHRLTIPEAMQLMRAAVQVVGTESARLTQPEVTVYLTGNPADGMAVEAARMAIRRRLFNGCQIPQLWSVPGLMAALEPWLEKHVRAENYGTAVTDITEGNPVGDPVFFVWHRLGGWREHTTRNIDRVLAWYCEWIADGPTLRGATTPAEAKANAQNLAFLRKPETVSGMARQLAKVSGIGMHRGQWNTNPWLVGMPTGVMDLTGDGAVRPYTREDYISRRTAVDMAPEGTTPTALVKVVDSMLEGDAEAANFLQRVLGYSLCGDTQEQTIAILAGATGCGKSTTLKAVAQALGGYAVAANMDSFMTQPRGIHRNTQDVASWVGSRLVYASEAKVKGSWDLARMQSLSSGDPIQVNQKWKIAFGYWPEFTLVFAMNDVPALEGGDASAVARRFALLPVTQDTPDSDMVLVRAALDDDLRPAVLRWLFEGWQDWKRRGLVRPKSVQERTDAYFAMADVVSQWVNLHTVPVPMNLEDPSRIREQGWPLAEAFSLFTAAAGLLTVTGTLSDPPKTLRAFRKRLEKIAVPKQFKIVKREEGPYIIKGIRHK